MGIAGFVVLIMVATAIVGFLLYGLFTGFSRMFRLSRQLWLRLVLPEAQMAEAKAMSLRGSQVERQVRQGGSEVRCWDVKKCPVAMRESCPAYEKKDDLPCWLALMLSSKDYRLKADCLACQQFKPSGTRATRNNS